MANALHLLRHANVRFYFVGICLASIAMFMQLTALGWFVYRLSGSPFLLGVSAFAFLIPMLVVTPIAGLLADRVDRRRFLRVTQSCSLALGTLLAALTIAGIATVAVVIGLALALGIVCALDASARNVFLLDLVGNRADLPNAIALQALSVNVARFVGPALAGVAVAELGEGWTFALTAAGYIPLLAALVRLQRSAAARPRRVAAWHLELVEGFRYVLHVMPLRRLAMLVAVMSLAIGPYGSVMPVFARDTLGGDARTLGWLLSAAGLGALIATGYLASRRGVPGLGRVVAAAAVTTSVAMMAFSQTRALWQALPCLVALGFGYIAVNASINTLMQALAEDHLRGRIVGIFLMVAIGLVPVGNLAVGALVEWIGERPALLACGLAGVAAALWFIRGYPTWREAVRPLYQRAGLLAPPPT
jgi:MFS family permease